jgi:hypothetical protein
MQTTSSIYRRTVSVQRVMVGYTNKPPVRGFRAITVGTITIEEEDDQLTTGA